MPKTGRNIYKRKDGRWEGRYIKKREVGGKIIYGYVYGKTCTEAKQKLTMFNSKESILELPAVNFDKINLTFADIANRWLPIISMRVKPSTYAGYKAALDLHILPYLGKFEIQGLSAIDIGCFAKDKLEKGRIDGKGGLSAKTVRDILSIIKAVIDFAGKENFINSGFKITYPKQHKKAMRVLSRQEQKYLEAALINDINIQKLGILFCLYTGLRIGEICALRWQDISSDFDMVSVRQTLQRTKNLNDDENKTKILIDTPKSPSSVRNIPLPKFLSVYLREFISDSREYFLATEDKIFTEPRTMQNHFMRIIKASNIAEANYHCLRHTFATRCIEAGVDIKSLSEMLGHSNVNITLNRYVHSLFEQKREGIDKLEKNRGV